jgi:DNA-binding CsgD family transcriptional regulator
VLVEYDRAERFLRDGIGYAERVELWNDRHYMAAHLAHVLWAVGRWDEAQSIAEHALADGRGGITTRITALHVLGYLALVRGDSAAAEAVLQEALEAGQRMGELQRIAPALWGLAELSIVRGDPAAAVVWVEHARVLSAAVRDAAYLFPFLVTGARAFLALADPAAAARWVAAVEASLSSRSIPGTMPAVDHAHGLLELAAGRLGAARDALARAVEGWSTRRRIWEATWARVDLARALVRSNRLAEAARLLEDVERTATELGSPSLLSAARAALRDRHGGAAATEAWAPLTQREYEVARLVADGETNSSIADRLVVSPRTVGAHVEHILAKLGASRRTEIAAWIGSISSRAETGKTPAGSSGAALVSGPDRPSRSGGAASPTRDRSSGRS